MDSLISILVPCRNEGKYIQACLDSVLAFDVPAGVKVEILVLDGRSIDHTRELVLAGAMANPCIRWIDNPGLATPHGLNVGIREARGNWILRLDAHAEYPRDYLAQCYATALRTHAANTGGICLTEAGNDTYSARLVQALTTHRFGVGNSGFRIGSREGAADTVPFGFFPRALFDKIGLFDERLVRNQDYEFNRRILASGQTVWLNPAIRCRYFNQPTLSAFLKKQFQYEGPYNPYLWYLAPYAFTWRHAITAFFSAGVLGGLILFACTFQCANIFAAVMGLYALVAIVSAAQQAIRYRQPLHIVALPWCFFAYHFVHGLGVLTGLAHLVLKRAPVQRDIPPWPGATHRRWTPKIELARASSAQHQLAQS